jgi:hypothetical protein
MWGILQWKAQYNLYSSLKTNVSTLCGTGMGQILHNTFNPFNVHKLKMRMYTTC